MTSKRALPTLNQLQGVLIVLENKKRRPAAEVLNAVGEMVRDAISVLQEPDPLKQRIGFVLLAIQQSTDVTRTTIRGKEINRVKILDQPLYAWAMAEVHAMAGNGR